MILNKERIVIKVTISMTCNRLYRFIQIKYKNDGTNGRENSCIEVPRRRKVFY